ncbi:hypothetical protein EI94DRAFT_1808595 [Lactarius quietus]|nr:hypothetical protein EI94DRAFT_1808595 [Lactarius quietus]
MSNSNHHPENPHLPGTPAGGSSVRPSELAPYNRMSHTDSRPYPVAGFPTTLYPDYLYGPQYAPPATPRTGPTLRRYTLGGCIQTL